MLEISRNDVTFPTTFRVSNAILTFSSHVCVNMDVVYCPNGALVAPGCSSRLDVHKSTLGLYFPLLFFDLSIATQTLFENLQSNLESLNLREML